METPTEKQLEIISEMEEALNAPQFTGTTRKEACVYIGRYYKRYRLITQKETWTGDELYSWRR